jgi:Ca2+-binding RTX toxin-like protein
MYGLDGNDVLTGGSGNDYLHGNLGDDTLSGGNGVTRFWAAKAPTASSAATAMT